MAYIWKARSATPGAYNFVAGTLENLAPAAKFQDGETRGDGVPGTLEVSSTGIAVEDIVDAAYVVVGHDNYVGGEAGEYPTTATSQAAERKDIKLIDVKVDLR